MSEPVVSYDQVSAAPPTPERLRNPFETGLWVLAVVLVAIGVVGMLAASGFFGDISTQLCDADGNCRTTPLASLYQISYFVLPSLFTGGILCAVAAVSIRAMDLNARRRADSDSAALTASLAGLLAQGRGLQAEHAAERTIVPENAYGAALPDVWPSLAEPPQPTRRTTADYSAFMRPSSERSPDA